MQKKNIQQKHTTSKKSHSFLLESFLSQHIPKKCGVPSHEYIDRKKCIESKS